MDINKISQHFENLSSAPTGHEQAPEDSDATGENEHTPPQSFDDPFTESEVKKLIESLKNGKACGLDFIRNEFLKNMSQRTLSVVTRLFNVVLRTGIVPEAWCIGAIVPLYKGKGPKDDLDNYRGITLLSCIGKLFTSLINKRLTDFLESTGSIGPEQAGFRKGHSTTDHAFALHMLIELYKQKGKRIYAAFVDYRKAFDYVDRSALWSKLLKEGINGHVLRVIMNIYAKAKSCVKSSGKISRSFPNTIGVRQGENLSPLLFDIFLNDFEYSLSRRNGDYSYRGLPFISELYEQEIRGNGVAGELDVDAFFRIYCLLYADDTIILAESPEELQTALNALHAYCLKWKITVNVKKTKVIIFSRGVVKESLQLLSMGINIWKSFVNIHIWVLYFTAMGNLIPLLITELSKLHWRSMH